MTPDAPQVASATVGRVPNQPKTPLHSFRVSHDLWNEAKALATENGETIADVLRRALRAYIKRGKR